MRGCGLGVFGQLLQEGVIGARNIHGLVMAPNGSRGDTVAPYSYRLVLNRPRLQVTIHAEDVFLVHDCPRLAGRVASGIPRNRLADHAAHMNPTGKGSRQVHSFFESYIKVLRNSGLQSPTFDRNFTCCWRHLEIPAHGYADHLQCLFAGIKVRAGWWIPSRLVV